MTDGNVLLYLVLAFAGLVWGLLCSIIWLEVQAKKKNGGHRDN